MGWLLQLPCEVTVRCMGEGPNGSVLDEFMRARKQVDSLNDLKEFVSKWQAAWDTEDPKDTCKPEDVTSEVFKHFKRLQHHNAKFDLNDTAQVIAGRILLPGRFLTAGVVAQEYVAPFNVALIQLFADDADRKVVF